MANYLHINPVLVQCAEPELLEEVSLNSSLAKFVVKKISETALLADPEHADKIFDELVKKGYMPRRIQFGKE